MHYSYAEPKAPEFDHNSLEPQRIVEIYVVDAGHHFEERHIHEERRIHEQLQYGLDKVVLEILHSSHTYKVSFDLEMSRGPVSPNWDDAAAGPIAYQYTLGVTIQRELPSL